MFRRYILLLASLLFIPGGVCRAAEESNYLAMQLNIGEPDSARRIDGNSLGATFLYGFPLRNNIFIEARFTGLVLERDVPGETDFYQQEIGADAVYRFGDPGSWQPFVLLGLGAVRNDVDIDEDDGVTAGVHLGGGVTSGNLGDLGLKLRADVRYVHDQFIDGVQDLRIGLGIQIPLGDDDERAGRAANRFESREEDKDGDGVVDYRDACPNSLPYVRHDEDGCMEPNQTIRLYEITFNNGTSILTLAAREELGAIVRALRGQPALPIRINGHTDALGGTEENRRLSLERAEAVATHLALQGVPTQRMDVKGYGESQPVDSNATAAGRERNRRIEIVLLEAPSRTE